MYSSFWNDAANSLLIGENERVPFVRHDLFITEWEVIGKIIVKGFLDTKFFPVCLSKSFILFVLFQEVDSDDLIASILQYLSKDEKEMVEKALNDQNFEFQSEEFFEFLEQFRVRSLVNAENIKEIISEIARQELVQKPHIMASSWKTHFESLKRTEEFSCKSAVKQFFEKVMPSSKKLIKLISALPKDEGERDALSYFKRYIRGLKEEMLKKLLQFLTGSELLIFKTLEITFIKHDSSFERRPIAHTCGPCLELPSTYQSYCELREEFTNILNRNLWEMDII